MVPAIDCYRLDAEVASYGPLLIPFGREGYEWAGGIGRRPLFRGEEFYWAEQNWFLGRECQQAMVSAIDGRIHKISFRFHDTEPTACMDIREAAYKFIAGSLGVHSQLQEVGSDHKLAIWEVSNGNVIIEAEGYDTEIITTTLLSAEVTSAGCHSERRPPPGGRSRRISLGLRPGTESHCPPKAQHAERFFAPPARRRAPLRMTRSCSLSPVPVRTCLLRAREK